MSRERQHLIIHPVYPRHLPKEGSGHTLANSVFNPLTVDVAHIGLNVYIMRANKVR